MRVGLDSILTQMGALQLSQKDEEILAHLTDIECEELEPTEDEDGDELAGFKLTFRFSKNPNFDHESLVGCPATVLLTRKNLPIWSAWACGPPQALCDMVSLDAAVCILALQTH